jgi:hypothetical protein
MVAIDRGPHLNAADSRIARFFPRKATSGGFLAKTRAVVASPGLADREEIGIAVVLTTGLALVVYGVGSIYRPLGLIVAGLLLVAITLGYLRGKGAGG